ncbi:MAG: hypothetical protein WC322_06330 [Candidatus Paceibacterota bacterium]
MRVPVKAAEVRAEKPPADPKRGEYEVGWRSDGKIVKVLFVARLFGAVSTGHVPLDKLLGDITHAMKHEQESVSVFVGDDKYNFELPMLMDKLEESGALEQMESQL